MRRVFWVVAGFLCIGSTVEVSARMYGFGQPLLYRAAESGYEIVPNQRVNRMGHITTINNIGTRGPTITQQAAPGTYRAIVLGDSVANGGTMMDDELTFPAVASRILTAQGCKNEIINVSAGGWSLFDEIHWIHQHGVYGATAVVWTINFLDVDQPPNDSSGIDHYPSLPSRNPPLAVWEIMTRYAVPRLGLLPSTADAGSITGAVVDYDWETRVLDASKAFVESLVKQNVRIEVLYHDGSEPLAPARIAAKQRLLTKLADWGVDVTETKLMSRLSSQRLFTDIIHPNEAGSAIIGQQVSDLLLPLCKGRLVH